MQEAAIHRKERYLLKEDKRLFMTRVCLHNKKYLLLFTDKTVKDARNEKLLPITSQKLNPNSSSTPAGRVQSEIGKGNQTVSQGTFLNYFLGICQHM